MTPTWLSTLDALKGHLDVQADLIKEGRYDEVVAFAPPADLPTLPNVLVARASELLARALTLTERASAMRDDTLSRLTPPRHMPFTQRPVPAFVDQRA
jgi:hypothetical protein